MKKSYFFGWKNFKWLVKEIRNLYSGKPSYFEKKRVESSIAFLVGIGGMIFFLVRNVDKMSTSELVLWATVLFGMAGYTVKQIQKEKKGNKDESDEND